MKNRTMKNGIIAGLLLFAGVAMGGTKKEDVQYLDVKVTSNQQNIVYVNFEKLEGKTINIRVFDDNGLLIHTEKVDKNDAVLRKYLVPDTPNGPYSFEVVDTQMIKSKFDQK